MAFSVGIVLFYSTRMDEVSTDFGVWSEFVTYWFNMICPNLNLMGLTLPNYFPYHFFETNILTGGFCFRCIYCFGFVIPHGL